MNKQAVAYTDEILDVLFEKYNLPEGTPVVSTGGSMGGQSALVYTRYSKRTPVACVANCPVCDMVFHFTEREDLPRTIYSAYFNEDCTMNEALEKHSPLHLASQMPKIKYLIFHCDDDRAVNIDSHSRRFVEAMMALNHDISFVVVPDKGHCNIGDENYKKFMEFCINTIESI
jgi:dipeptidyl aminopeptidase/acylaminoacyl peptidase